MSPTAPFSHPDVYNMHLYANEKDRQNCQFAFNNLHRAQGPPTWVYLSSGLSGTEQRARKVTSIQLEVLFFRSRLCWNEWWLAAVTSPMLQREKNTFSKCRDSTLRPVCYKDKKGCVPGTPEWTQHFPQENGDAGQLCWVRVTYSRSGVTGNKLRWGKTGDTQPRFSPSLGSQESAHHLTAPLPLTLPVTTHDCLPLPPDSRSSQLIRKQTLPGTVFQESSHCWTQPYFVISYIVFFFFFFYWIKQLWSLSGPCPTFSPRKKKSVMNFLTLG